MALGLPTHLGTSLPGTQGDAVLPASAPPTLGLSGGATPGARTSLAGLRLCYAVSSRLLDYDRLGMSLLASSVISESEALKPSLPAYHEGVPHGV